MKNSGIEWIGNIPDSWSLSRLQWHLSEIKESNDPVKTTQVLSLTNKLGVIPYEEKGDHGNKAKENLNEYKLAYPGTIVANSMNILIGSVGKCDYFGCVSPVYYVFKPNDGENIDFLNYVFQTEQFQKELRRYANGILEIRLRVSASDILKREIAFPSKEVQALIVCYLNGKISDIDQLIEIEEQQINQLIEYKNAVITETLDGKTISGIVPFTKKKLRWMCDLISKGTTPSTIGRPVLSEGPVKFLRAENIQNSSVNLENQLFIDEETNQMMARSQLMANDILFVIAGATIGKTAILGSEHIPANTNQAVSFVRLSKNEQKRAKYIWYFLQSNHIKDKLNLLSVQSAQPNLSMEDLGNFFIPLYNEANESTIVEYLDTFCQEINETIAGKNKKIVLLEQYKKTLIYECITGKKEVE